MALTMEDLAKMFQETRTLLIEKLDTSIAKMQQISDISESRFTNVEAKIEQLREENLSLIKELKCKNLKESKIQVTEHQRVTLPENEVNEDDEKPILVTKPFNLINVEENDSIDGIKPCTSTSNNLDDEDAQFITDDHALMNILVLASIGQYLKFSDIRTFRLVCGRWNEVYETILWKLCRIKIANGNKPRYLHDSEIYGVDFESVAESNKKLIQSFESIFPPPGFPSNAIVFHGHINDDLLDYFWKDRGMLTLTNIKFYYFRTFQEVSRMCIDVNHYLSSNVTTLHIRDICSSGKWRISLDALPNIQNLHLENCKVVLNGKIAPRELILEDSNSVFFKDKLYNLSGAYYIREERILINEFVDFSNIKRLRLSGYVLILDVGSIAVELEELYIHDVEVMGLINSQWTTNHIDFKFGNSCSGNKMEIKLISGYRNGFIEQGALPMLVERLSVKLYRDSIPPRALLYPKLKSLTITKSNNSQFPILDFASCPSLVEFDLRIENEISEMDLDRIKLPASIKRVKLRNVEVTTNVPWQLDTLVLDKYPFSIAKTFLRYFNTVKLTVNLNTALNADEILTPIITFFGKGNIQELAIGKIDWPASYPFLNSEFSEFVNEMGNYYLFRKYMQPTGKTIDKELFDKMCNF